MKLFVTAAVTFASAICLAGQEAAAIVFINGPGGEELPWQRDEAVRRAEDSGWEKVVLASDAFVFFNMDRLGITYRRDQMKLIDWLLDNNAVEEKEVSAIIGRQLKSLFGDDYFQNLGNFDPVQVSVGGSAVVGFGEANSSVFRSIPTGGTQAIVSVSAEAIKSARQLENPFGGRENYRTMVFGPSAQRRAEAISVAHLKLSALMTELQQSLSDKTTLWKKRTNESLFSKIDSVASNGGKGQDLAQALPFLQLDEFVQGLDVRRAYPVIELKFKLAGERSSLTIPIG